MSCDPVEERFRAQYQSLDNDTLREIAAGDVPWTEDGHYLYAAQRAAHAILVERAAADVPRIPLWDPAGQVPWRIRAAVIGLVVLLAVGMVMSWAWATPTDVPTDDELCTKAQADLAKTDFAYHFKLSTDACDVRRSEAVREGAVEVIPIAFDSCVHLTGPLLTRVANEKNPVTLRAVNRFTIAPAPGRHCAPGQLVYAEGLVRPGHPWQVRLTRVVP